VNLRTSLDFLRTYLPGIEPRFLRFPASSLVPITPYLTSDVRLQWNRYFECNQPFSGTQVRFLGRHVLYRHICCSVSEANMQYSRPSDSYPFDAVLSPFTMLDFYWLNYFLWCVSDVPFSGFLPFFVWLRYCSFRQCGYFITKAIIPVSG